MGIISEIRALAESDLFQQLNFLTERFDMFTVMGRHHDELVHSNVIAHFLDPGGTHGLGDAFLVAFLKTVGFYNKGMVGTLTSNKVRILREHKHIDILIDLRDHGIVIGIENKINHSERERQIADYQSALQQILGSYTTRHIVLLTPTGRDSITADPENTMTTLSSLSYNEIATIAESVAPATPKVDVKAFISQFVEHIRRNILEQSDIRNVCLELYRKHPRAYRALIANLRDLSDIEEAYFDLVKRKYGDLKCTAYRGSELSVRNPAWPLDNAHIKLHLDADMSMKIFAAIHKSTAESRRHDFMEEFGVTPWEVRRGWDWWTFSTYGVVDVENPDGFGNQAAKSAFNSFCEIYDSINTSMLKFSAT